MIYIKVSAVVCKSFFHENISTSLLLKIVLHMFVKGWLFNDRCRVNAESNKD